MRHGPNHGTATSGRSLGELRDETFDIVIVGCGPVGALAGNLAALTGLRVLVLDRETQPQRSPRAVHIDHEMMRLFQAAGLADVMLPGMRETQGHLHIGADHGVIRYMGTAGRPKPFGWPNDYFFHQPELEARLREGLTRFDNVQLRLGETLMDLTQDAASATLHLVDASGREHDVRTRWVIGCDGARSTVRGLLNIGLEDLQFEEPWLVVDVEVHGSVRFPDVWGVPAEADLQQLSVMMCDPDRPATIVPGRGDLRRWEFMLLPGERDEDMARTETVVRLLDPFIGGVPHKIERAATYRFHGLIAEQWRSGNVFLAGDAAHQTPPFFGQGMCHGMRDVANLIWKLDLVSRGIADESLLETYQVERDPHVRSVVTAAVEAGRYICELDRGRAAARDEAMRERARNGISGTAADLIPTYKTGAVAAGSPGAGERFIQPQIGSDLLDDVTGSGWRLFAVDTVATEEGKRLVRSCPELKLTVIDASGLGDQGAVQTWLTSREVRFALLRPDAYVFGTAKSEAAPLFAQARLTLALTRDAEAVAC